ncbi:MAG: DUF1587 domain-containing protein, partial [Planctomycetaceae bacterium]|nr:DUF1587 domain-containing protein [Planctomycetaceae bacterium]
MARLLRLIPVPLVLISLVCTKAIAADSEPGTAFQRDVQPVLAKYCYRCHNEKKSSADLKLHNLDRDLVNGSDAETWHDVLNKLNVGEMPPKEEPQPSETDRQKLVQWITQELKRATQAKQSTGGKVVVRRLTRYEYANTMRDLLGVNLNFAADLPPESSSPDGFQNNGAVLAMSPLQLEYYLQAARKGLEKAIVTGEKPQVYHHHAEKSEAVGGRKKKNMTVDNRLPPGGLFQAKMDEFPREGEFLIRVKAGARSPDNQAFPRLSVAVGVRADVLSPMRRVDEVDIEAPLDQPQVYEFRGRIEDFPLPGKNPKYPGMLIQLTHVGKAPPAPKKNQKKQDTKPQPEDPAQPLIEVESVDFEGPIFDAWPPSSHTRIFIPSNNSNDENLYAREIIAHFMQRAFRRPIKPVEVEPMMELFSRVRPRSATFEQAIREVLAMVLISPDFLYLLEPRDNTTAGPNKSQPVTDYELATRLSYFLWSTMPDESLLDLAAKGKLRDS